ncbi:MAG: hypothetical protein FWE42_03560 [Defluviitaleaceae bacterium]|nr:hypothetical protein [Defluviitaleaceae bacterium]
MKKSNIIIELTPLLDVILIMLFFILVQSEGRMGDFYEDTRAALESEFAVLEAGLEEYKAQHAQEMGILRDISEDYAALRLGLADNTGLIMVSIASDANDSNIRSVLIETDLYNTAIELCWNNLARESAALELNTTLSGLIHEMNNTIVILVFRFDSREIFAADHRLITNAIHIQRQFFNEMVIAIDMRI